MGIKIPGSKNIERGNKSRKKRKQSSNVGKLNVTKIYRVGIESEGEARHKVFKNSQDYVAKSSVFAVALIAPIATQSFS